MLGKNDLHLELLEVAERLEQLAQEGQLPDVKTPLEELEGAANTVGKAWSGSWIGYQSRIYYSYFKPPPPGDHFNSWAGRADTDNWKEVDNEKVQERIYEKAGNPDLQKAERVAERARKAFESDKLEVMSLLNHALLEQEDSFLAQLKDRVEKTNITSRMEFIHALQPSKFSTLDVVAGQQGIQIPPHLSILSLVYYLRNTIESCAKLGQFARKAGSHLARLQRQTRRSLEIGTNVFIGHGRSPVWRELKDFVQDRLHLPWDEFNRIPVAGVTNVARLSELLQSAAMAFLVMTGEDEQADGTMNARMNVIHEAGLFQGRLGFNRAIILLEEGCEGFSNIEGLGQIPFPKGNITAAFEKVREVLEREGLIVS
ncbi:MAG: hypothetical protein C4520_06035 [Candidatus Abyssobacteria bacterium SURF_5]|uniref:CD-NTase-associated protein 12/Pycsar effector protein TIR domain-containing protein n=1 Tax=Abyssobacteria bacterium (strain SURF_5) TaxID=2093360 RepID=A0A3A4NSJ7_ABYX5|nr:MAG: hypothetical protein C4520_06035 [Candidatus Abyssubacteria bacterium SURF_5]